MKQNTKELIWIFITTIILFLYSIRRSYMNQCEVDWEMLVQCNIDIFSILFAYVFYLLTIVSVIVLVVKFSFSVFNTNKKLKN